MAPPPQSPPPPTTTMAADLPRASNPSSSASNFSESTERPLTASFSGQSGSVQSFHHFGSLVQRNAGMSGLPSSGVQQPGGSILGGFASNNLPGAMSQVETVRVSVEKGKSISDSQSDRRLLLIRQEDDEHDDLSATVQRIGRLELTTPEELSGQIVKLHTKFQRWEQVSSNTEEHVHLTRELLTSCEDIEREMDELEWTMSVASSEPSYHALEDAEFSRRGKWTTSARNQVGIVKRAVERGKSISAIERHQGTVGTSRTNQNQSSLESSESSYLQYDDEFDDPGASVQKIRGVGLITQGELSRQSNINSSASNLPDSTASFSGQSGSVQSFHHSGLHNINGNYNLPNMPESLTQRNAGSSGLPSSGVQQPGGSISGGFASNNLPGAMSQDPLLNQKDALNNYPCTLLDEKATIKALKIVSVSALTTIIGLSTYTADTLAFLASRNIRKEVLLMSPYICVPVGLVGVALSLCASETNGLADCAAIAIIIVCLFVIYLGGFAVIIIDSANLAHPAVFQWYEFWTFVLILGLLCGWGWLFAYPRFLKFSLRMTYWNFFDRRKSTRPRCAAYADLDSAQSTDQKGCCGMLSSIVPAVQRFFHPLGEDATIDFMKIFSVSLVSAITGLSLWLARTMAPRAYMPRMVRRFVFALPFFYLPLALIGTVLAVSATRSNGLANCASWLGLVLLAFGILLGAFCSIFLLHTGPVLTVLVAEVLILALLCAWGWMLAYPKALRFVMHQVLCARCAPLGRYLQGCGCNSWGWIFGSLKVLGRSVVYFVARCFGLSFRTARGWRTAEGELDLESGTAALELTSLTVKFT